MSLPSAPRVGLLPPAVLAAIILVLSPAAGAAGRRVDIPSAAELARGTAIVDSTLSANAAARLARAGFWGGPLTASDGEAVTVYVSDTYPQDPAIPQRWANFLASLVHGSELSSLKAYLMPLTDVQSYCGRNALACYNPTQSALVAPGDDPAADTSAEAVVAHEYGHHVAAHRSDAPWAAIDYGTKRWASYEQVCSRAEDGDLVPGAETVADYQRNPGEAFAETYRVLNERALGLAETPWDIVTTSLYPDDTALALVRQDVLEPWTGATVSTYRGSSGRKYSVPTQLDGTLRVTVSGSAKARFRLSVSSGANALASFTTTAGHAKTSQLTLCGQRNVGVTVRRLTKQGTYALKVSKP